MPLQPIIVSTVGQALDGTTDNDLLDVIRKTSIELQEILNRFDQTLLQLEIMQDGKLCDMAGNQVRPE